MAIADYVRDTHTSEDRFSLIRAQYLNPDFLPKTQAKKRINVFHGSSVVVERSPLTLPTAKAGGSVNGFAISMLISAHLFYFGICCIKRHFIDTPLQDEVPSLFLVFVDLTYDAVSDSLPDIEHLLHISIDKNLGRKKISASSEVEIGKSGADEKQVSQLAPLSF